MQSHVAAGACKIEVEQQLSQRSCAETEPCSRCAVQQRSRTAVESCSIGIVLLRLSPSFEECIRDLAWEATRS